MKSRTSSSVERDASATSELVRSSVMIRNWPRRVASGVCPGCGCPGTTGCGRARTRAAPLWRARAAHDLGAEELRELVGDDRRVGVLQPDQREFFLEGLDVDRLRGSTGCG